VRKLLFAVVAVFAAVSTAPAVPPLTMTVIGSLQIGGVRDADPRIAAINAYDPSGKRVYVVNPEAGVLDVIDITAPAGQSPIGKALLIVSNEVGSKVPRFGTLEPWNPGTIQGRANFTVTVITTGVGTPFSSDGRYSHCLTASSAA
jgi:hypothetical protein